MPCTGRPAKATLTNSINSFVGRESRDVGRWNALGGFLWGGRRLDWCRLCYLLDWSCRGSNLCRFCWGWHSAGGPLGPDLVGQAPNPSIFLIPGLLACAQLVSIEYGFPLRLGHGPSISAALAGWCCLSYCGSFLGCRTTKAASFIVIKSPRPGLAGIGV